MEKAWFIYLNEQQEGPYSLAELKRDDRLSPDTFAWREGMPDWKLIAEIADLHDLFEPEAEQEEEPKGQESQHTPLPDDELVLDFRKGPPFLMLWLLIALILVFYLFYEFYWWS